MLPMEQKGWNEDPENHRPVSLTSVPGKVMKQIILITQHMQDSQGSGPGSMALSKAGSA